MRNVEAGLQGPGRPVAWFSGIAAEGSGVIPREGVPMLLLAQGLAKGTQEWGAILPSPISDVLTAAGHVAAVMGAVVILWGVLSSFVRLIPVEFGEIRGARSSLEKENELRRRMGFHMLTGLEFLVAADLIATLVAPSLQHLGILAGIVLIRTVVGATLHWELSRRQEFHEKVADPNRPPNQAKRA